MMIDTQVHSASWIDDAGCETHWNWQADLPHPTGGRRVAAVLVELGVDEDHDAVHADSQQPPLEVIDRAIAALRQVRAGLGEVYGAAEQG